MMMKNDSKTRSFKFPFSAPAVFIQVYSNKDALKANLINWFLTNRGERIMNPNFGANLRSYIFEAINQNTFESLEMKIEDDVKNFFPQVNVQNLEVVGNQEYNRIKIILTYFVSQFNSSDTVELTYK